MNRPVRILATIASAALLVGGAGIAGYQLGHTEAAEAIHDAKCSAVQGLELRPLSPLGRAVVECVWKYQVSEEEWLERGLRRECVCG